MSFRLPLRSTATSPSQCLLRGKGSNVQFTTHTIFGGTARFRTWSGRRIGAFKRDILFWTYSRPRDWLWRTNTSLAGRVHRLLRGELCTCNHNHFLTIALVWPKPDPHRESIGILLALSWQWNNADLPTTFSVPHSDGLVPAAVSYPSASEC